MTNYEIIRNKLRDFIRRFYLNELIKGLILFTTFGLFYFLVTSLIEYVLWLSSLGRTLLFWSFVGIGLLLVGRYVLYPILKLLQISRNMDDLKASVIIGRFFPEVGDKLLNVLQLKRSTNQSELLIASIEQKAMDLRTVPFSLAVNFRKSLKGLKYAALPILVVLIVSFSGKSEVFTSSFKRIVNYNNAYVPPAPFAFQLSRNLEGVMEDESFTLEVRTVGRVFPENVRIHYKGGTFFMDPVSPGVFKYTFEPVSNPFQLWFSANGVISEFYSVDVVTVPRTRNLKMELDYPDYTGMEDEVMRGSGSAMVPEGTVIEWKISTIATDQVRFTFPDTILNALSDGSMFSLKKEFKVSAQYEISTSNEKVRNFERMTYRLHVVKDEFPTLVLDHKTDSIDEEKHFFYGNVSDDHGISNAKMIVRRVKDPGKVLIIPLQIGNDIVGEFFAGFPDSLDVEKGYEYEVYFEISDNDAINGLKTVKSRSYILETLTDEEKKENLRKSRDDVMEGLDRTLEKMSKAGEGIYSPPGGVSKMGYKERSRLENFLDQENIRNERLKLFMKKFKQNLNKEEKSYNQPLNKELLERITERELELQNSEDILKEIQEYSEKLEADGLRERIDKFTKKREAEQRSLEQLLELTKKYYVQEELQEISEIIEGLGNEQLKTLSGENQEVKQQDSLNRETNEALDKLEEVEKENDDLKNSFDINWDEVLEKEIRNNQGQALEKLEQDERRNARENQKVAGKKLQKGASLLKNSILSGGAEQMSQDAESVRQIVNNLLVFSFEQEDLMEDFRTMGNNSLAYAAKLKDQNALKENFEHIDDSIYMLALRNPVVTENINALVVEVSYELGKVLERFSDNQYSRGMASQQYVMTGVNELAYFLGGKLVEMERMLNNPAARIGKGPGEQMQLKDIIIKQGNLIENISEELNGRKGGIEHGEDRKRSQEEASEKVFRIYQEQQMLRMALEKLMPNSKSQMTDEMKQIERDLLKEGLSRRTMERMRHLEQQLLDLNSAELQHGQNEIRESKFNREQFQNTTNPVNSGAKEYFNTSEILNRQILPLRHIYRLKVREYFERGDN